MYVHCCRLTSLYVIRQRGRDKETRKEREKQRERTWEKEIQKQREQERLTTWEQENEREREKERARERERPMYIDTYPIKNYMFVSL